MCGFLFWQTKQIRSEAQEARVTAQNQIAELSSVIEEDRQTWSRLAQERSDAVEVLRDQIPELAQLIRDRNEEITHLTTALARFRDIRVVVTEQTGASQTQVPSESDDPERLRVDFDTIHQDFIRISGHTLTTPPEATVQLRFLRPVGFTVVTTQQEDLSWRTYIHSDWDGLEIGDIESQVNPITTPAMRRDWTQDFSVGVFGAGAVTGNSGIFGLDINYDFGSVEVGVLGGGIIYPQGVDFMIGGRASMAPFDF